jgi:hypothetical protein
MNIRGRRAPSVTLGTRHLLLVEARFLDFAARNPPKRAFIRQKRCSNVTVQGPCDPIKEKVRLIRISIKIISIYAWPDFIVDTL